MSVHSQKQEENNYDQNLSLDEGAESAQHPVGEGAEEANVRNDGERNERTEPRTKNHFLVLTSELNTTTAEPTAEDEIIDSYADSDTVSKSTVLYSARHKLTLALVLRERLQEDEICQALRTCILGIASSAEEMEMVVEAARADVKDDGEDTWGLRMRSLLVVAAAAGVLELVDTERAGEVRELLGNMTWKDRKAGEREGTGMEKGKAKAV